MENNNKWIKRRSVHNISELGERGARTRSQPVRTLKFTSIVKSTDLHKVIVDSEVIVLTHIEA